MQSLSGVGGGSRDFKGISDFISRTCTRFRLYILLLWFGIVLVGVEIRKIAVFVVVHGSVDGRLGGAGAGKKEGVKTNVNNAWGRSFPTPITTSIIFQCSNAEANKTGKKS